MSAAERRPDRVTSGVHDEFWAWCARGELRLQRCDSCAKLNWPPTTACIHCGGLGFAWERLSGRGTLASWCRFEKDYYRGALPMPWDTILVALEEGPLFVSNPRGFGWDEMAIDMPLRLVFVDAEDTAGPFRLPLFERADQSPK